MPSVALHRLVLFLSFGFTFHSCFKSLFRTSLEQSGSSVNDMQSIVPLFDQCSQIIEASEGPDQCRDAHFRFFYPTVLLVKMTYNVIPLTVGRRMRM